MCDKGGDRMSVNPVVQKSIHNESAEYELFSDRYQRMVSSRFVLSQTLQLLPAPEKPVVNLKQLREILLSTDLSRNAELDWTKDEFRLLDGESISGNQIAFQSFARSGNSFLRRFLELITGVYTGSDMNLNLTMNLMFNGLHGEGHVADGNRVWVTKTHYPFQSPMGVTKFESQKQIVIVRNPIDVLPSMAHMAWTGSQSETPKEKYHEDFPEAWNTFIKNLCPVIAANHKRIINTIS